MNAVPLSLKQRFQLSRFFRGEAPVAGPIRLGHRRIFILPTARGLVCALLIALLGLIAFVYSNNLAYLLCFLLASIFFVSILHSFKALAGLEINATYSPPVFAGEMAGFNFQIRNPAAQPRPALELALQDTQTLNLEPQESRSITLYVRTRQRGWLNCSTLKIASRYPFGWFQAWSPLRFDNPLLVYPQPAPVAAAFPESDAGHGQQGQNKRRGDEFYGLTPYQTGDSIRQIHWKSFAKGQGLHSKQYAGASSAELWLDYAHAPGNQQEERLSHLCRWLIDAEQAGLRYGLILPGIRLELDGGARHLTHCLEALALF